jgi:transcriptional regulator with XRE-family HTH domain
MKFKHKKLRALMEEKGITNEELGKVIGMSERSVRRRFDGEVFFDTQEIMRVCNFLGISAKQMPSYFFPIKKGNKTINE